MFEGFKETNFMTALNLWDKCNKKVKCYYRQKVYTFETETDFRKDFAVHGGQILEGLWFVEI